MYKLETEFLRPNLVYENRNTAFLFQDKLPKLFRFSGNLSQRFFQQKQGQWPLVFCKPVERLVLEYLFGFLGHFLISFGPFLKVLGPGNPSNG